MQVDIFNTENKYQIIYTDPPWEYGGSGGTKWSPASSYYKTLSINKLKEFKTAINNITYQESALLFMWIPSPVLKQGIELGEIWGFKFITVGFVWYKMRANVGNYTMSSCEMCLIFKKGKIPADRVRNPGTKQFYQEPISIHSRKPDEFRKRIESIFPTSSKIELFARTEFINWDSFGDEL